MKTDNTQPETLRVKVLKYFVIVFGIFLIFATIIMLSIAALKYGQKDKKVIEVSSAPSATATAVEISDYDVVLNLPPRARVKSTTVVDGGYLAVTVRLAQDRDQIILVDLKTGQVKGKLTLQETN